MRLDLLRQRRLVRCQFANQPQAVAAQETTKAMLRHVDRQLKVLRKDESVHVQWLNQLELQESLHRGDSAGTWNVLAGLYHHTLVPAIGGTPR